MNCQAFYKPDESLAKERLHYAECGLDSIYLLNGFFKETYDGEDYVTITDMDGLHEAIGLHIILSRKAPSGKELRFLRNEMEMSQVDLANHLSISDQSVARWEKGHTEAPGPAVFAIKVLFVFSLTPDDERDTLIQRFLEAIKTLTSDDETDDSATFAFSGGEWKDAA